MLKYVIMWIFISSLFGQNIIGVGLTGETLRQFLEENYRPDATIGYGPARDVLWGEIDIQSGNVLECVYTGFTVVLDLDEDPSSDAYSKGINCEHTWPGSMGADNYPMEADMHHLFPTEIDVNSARGNDPFKEIPDDETDLWFRNGNVQNYQPSSNIDEYSERDESGFFEVREEQKGNTARAMFYFYCIYNEVADEAFFQGQKDELYHFHQSDSVDALELARSNAIAEYQYDKDNPFVLDATLPMRIWWPEDIVEGCTDPEADNFNPDANLEDGSCSYLSTTNEIADVFQMQIFPNPANPNTELRFDLLKSGNVRIEIKNLRGQRVQVLDLGFLMAGMQCVPIEVNELDSGQYFVSILGTKAPSLKFTVLK